MKRLTLALATLALVTLTVQAQHSATERADKRTQEISAAANLTPLQVTQVKQIFLDAFTKIDALGKDRSQQDAIREQRQAIMQEAKKKVDAILTDDQKTAVKASVKEKRQNRQPRRQGEQNRNK
jgi:hypothetical protein